MNVYRAILITGSPGVGKLTSAYLCAEEGYTAIEMNANDARSKKLVKARRDYYYRKTERFGHKRV